MQHRGLPRPLRAPLLAGAEVAPRGRSISVRASAAAALRSVLTCAKASRRSSHARPEARPSRQFSDHPTLVTPAAPWLPRGAPFKREAPEQRAVVEDLGSREACCYYDEHGKLHRDGGGPALIEAWRNGNEWRESWYRHGTLHRTDGPAVRTFWDNGKRIYEYYVNGVRHRDDGPALIRINEIGEVELYTYYRQGRCLHEAFASDEELDQMAAREAARDNRPER